MSSRSLAAARARRAGENAPPVSGNRPGMSVGSHAAFAPPPQMPQGYNYNAQPNNVRAGRPGRTHIPKEYITILEDYSLLDEIYEKIPKKHLSPCNVYGYGESSKKIIDIINVP